MSTRKLESILCVDDDADICDILRITLCLIAGLDVQTVGCGEDLIDLARKKQPDLVLMDIMMPGLDGPATYKRMRDDPVLANIPVIFLTAKAMRSDVAPLRRLGALGVITKPFDPVRLGDQVLALWNRSVAPRPSASPYAGPAQIHAHIDLLAQRFFERATGDVVRLRQIIEQARQGDATVLKEVEHISHSIHGTGAMLGFLRVSALGEAIERLAAGMNENADAHGPIGESALAQQLSDYIERLAEAITVAARAAPTGTGMLSPATARR